MGVKLHEYHMDKTACRYIFKSGKVATFVGGIFRTSSELEIKELDAEIEAGIGSIFTMPGSEVVDSDDIDPIAVFKRKIIAEYEAEKARSLNNGESFSDTNTKPVGTNAMGGNAGTSNSGVATAAVGAARAVPAGSIKLSK